MGKIRTFKQTSEGLMDLVTITFKNWHKFNPRKDFKHPVWFAMSNRVTEDDKIQTLSDKEFRAFIHLVCLTSQANKSGEAEINLVKAERLTGIARNVFSQVVEKLCEYGICTSSVRNPNATLHNITDNTLHNTTAPVAPNLFSDAFEKYVLKIKGPDAEKRYRAQIKTPEDHEKLVRSIANYKRMLALPENSYRRPKQTFASYLGTPTSGYFWHDYIDWAPEDQAKAQESEEDRVARMVKEMEDHKAKMNRVYGASA